MMNLINRTGSIPRPLLMAVVIVVVGVVGVLDYMIGFELSLAIFYLVPVLLAVWFIGRGFAIFVSILSVTISLIGDVTAGALRANSVIPWWNTLIVLTFYLAFIPLVTSLRSLQQELVEKTEALTEEKRALRLLSGRLISAQEEERLRISRDLHDDLGQIVASMNLDLQRALQMEDLQKKKDLIERAISENQEASSHIRELSTLLRPPILDDIGLKEALQTYLSEFSSRTGIETIFKFEHDRTLPKEATVVLYRIIQEALTNVLKHAKANSVRVDLSSTDKELTLEVQDNGRGFDPGSTGTDKGLGLAGMKERSELLRGVFGLTSAPGQGTKITVTVPLQQN